MHDYRQAQETCHLARLPPLLVLSALPLIQNGISLPIGIAGGVPGGGLAEFGATVPYIYDPKAELESRWSGPLADSLIDRLYRSTALLLPTGEVGFQLLF